MQGRIAVLESQRETLAAEIAEEVPAEVVWFTQPNLVREAFRTVEDQVVAGGDADAGQRLHDLLPDAVVNALLDLSPPVRLEAAQRSELVKRLGVFLEAEGFGQTRPSNPILASVSPRILRKLRDRFLIWTEQSGALVGRHVEKLQLMRQLTMEHLQAVRDLDEAELQTDEARELFERLSGELTDIERTLRDRSDKVAEHRVTEQQAQRKLAEHEDEVKRLEAKYAESTRKNNAYQYSLKVKRALEDYREKRRAQIKASVQDRLNMRVGLLLGPSELIKSVELDDQFVMSYFDARGDAVARHSISAGMRQLLAMAMLWALKDQADRPVPVVIDTPLGRIDRDNRALLLRDYFPKAGNPLVLLPTNSEITDAELDGLADHVCARYDIVNTDGQDAKIVLNTRHLTSGG